MRPPLVIDGLDALSQSEVGRKQVLVQRVQNVLALIGDPTSSPFFGTTRTALSPVDQHQLEVVLDAASQATSKLDTACHALRQELAVSAASTREGANTLLRVAARMQDRPMPLVIDAALEEWDTQAASLTTLVGQGERYATLHREFDSVIALEAWATPVADLRVQLAAAGITWWRAISGAYRAARSGVKNLCQVAPTSVADQLALLDAIIEEQHLRAQIERHVVLAGTLFGSLWQGTQSDWQALLSRAAWAQDVRKDVRAGALPEAFLAAVSRQADAHGLQRRRQQLEEAIRSYDTIVSNALKAAGFDDGVDCNGRPFRDADLTQQKVMLKRWRGALDELVKLIALNSLDLQCQREGIEQVVNLAQSHTGARSVLTDLFQLAWLEALLARAFRERPVLAEFDCDDHETCAQRFRAEDVRLLGTARADLSLQHWQQLPRHHADGQLAIRIREEVAAAPYPAIDGEGR